MRGGTALMLARLAAWWLLVASAIQLAGDLLMLLVAGHVSGHGPLRVLAMPALVLLRPFDPASAFAPHDGEIRAWVTFGLLLFGLGFAWLVLLRRGYANPLLLLRPDREPPLARQLTPRLADLGVWTAHDASRGDTKASFADRLRVRLLSRVDPGRDAARAVVNRANGMLVPFDDPVQPAARILLGTYRHLRLIRKRRFNVYARPEHHVVIFGPSGAGKGATQMNPSLLFWNGEAGGSLDGHGKGWPGAIITSTVKSDHVDVALEWRLSLSRECYVYDPLQLYPEYRDFWVGWSPLTGVRSFSDANAVAQALMESEQQQSGPSSGNEDYFRAQALMVLSPMILSAATSGLSFRTVYEWSLSLEAEQANPDIVGPDGEVDQGSRLFKVMDALYEYAERTGDETPLNQMQQVFAKDPREASGVWGSVRKTLQPYNDEKSVMSTDAERMPRMLDPRAFYSTPNSTLFIIAPEVANEAKRMRPVFAAFITWMIEEAQKLSRERNGKLPFPVLANLDEVKNVGAIPGLAHTLSLTRSIGFFVKHAWQDEAQIASTYGKDDAKTIASNSRTWVVLPGISDPEHLNALAQLIGERSARRGKLRGRKGEQDRPAKAASMSMVKELKDNELLILADNLPPFVIEAARYFKDPVMLARYEMGRARRETGQLPDRQKLQRLLPDVAAGSPQGPPARRPGERSLAALAALPGHQPDAQQAVMAADGRMGDATGPASGPVEHAGPGMSWFRPDREPFPSAASADSSSRSRDASGMFKVTIAPPQPLDELFDLSQGDVLPGGSSREEAPGWGDSLGDIFGDLTDGPVDSSATPRGSQGPPAPSGAER